MDTLGTKLAEARKSRGLTQEQLGAQVGFAQSIISRKEAGTLELTPCDIANLAKALIWPGLLKSYCRSCPATRAYRQIKEAG